MPKIYISGSRSSYNLHKEFGDYCDNIEYVKHNPQDISLIVLPGGADINPAIYGHEKNPHTGLAPIADARDEEAFEVSQRYNIPCAGICRGGQLLIAKAGGYLYQHTTGHHGDHLVRTNEGLRFTVTSCHHQMFGLPLPEESVLLAWSEIRLSRVYELADKEAQPPEVEPECVYLPTINSLAVQWHPEWSFRGNAPHRSYYLHALRRFLNLKTKNAEKHHASMEL